MTSRKTALPGLAKPGDPTDSQALLGDLLSLIEKARETAAQAMNSALTLLYWHIGQRIRSEVLAGARADYGEQMVSTVSRQLTLEYGHSFGEKNLRHMMRFAEVFNDPAIVFESALAAFKDVANALPRSAQPKAQT